MRVKVTKASQIIHDWLNELAKGNYEAIIKVWSGPKGTRRHFLRGVKTRINHHFLSDGEYRSGVRFEALPSTLDYFEQFPLWNLERAIRIASEMGIRYPTDKDGEAYVLSTDLVVRQYDPQSKQIIKVAKSYKPMSSLDFESRHPVSLNRTFEKLELERRYHEEEGTRFELITDAHVSKDRLDIHPAYGLTRAKSERSLRV
ncbi:TnsA endonuclease N-terminal domain-containing protein [Agarivorans sp. QJM3NY_29]|uniref:TnsA endonuclease N-terminal domain-containing protein n=1 Tax=unclassified Agarivorans TaxID=2636026 RepID=UPI003D7CF5F9